ncbi:MAG: AAA family ATPase [Actinobacteria bacterium]|nr:AAA family ATPase [Actinomycetota bacterium]
MVRKTVTLVFCDVADSTPLGERLDPESLRDVWSRYHETARDVLERHGGTIEKFVGDAVMAAFGIPVVHEDDAVRAVRAAVELREAITELNVELERAYGVLIEVRTGINTGEVIAGDPAQGQSFATGDAVVVAQRLEAAAAGSEILVGDATMRLVRDAVTAEPVPPLELKGKSEPVAAWRLLDVEPGVAGVSRRMDSPLVGRSAELARLRAELEQAKAERTCRTVAILGEPGVGKSRLAAELVASLGEEALVLEGRCLPYGHGITYWPLVEIVRGLDLDAVLDGELDGEAIQSRILEAVGRAETRSRSDELYWAVRRLLETLARDRPVVLVLDDIQWAEPAFLDLVEYLAGWSRDAAILVCCLARTEFADIRPSWPLLPLGPLSPDDAAVLLENLAGPLDPAAARRLGRATGGNPLFVEEMVRMLAEEERLDDRGRSLVAELDSLRVPETIQAVLAARLDRLADGERDVLQRASVIGQVFWWGAMAELTPPDRVAAVSGQLQALVRKGLIRPDRRTLAGEDGFRFAHILVRDAAYDATSKRLRGELHERFADWLESRARDAPEHDEILGHHLEQARAYRLELGPAGAQEADLATRASDRLARAGRRALNRGDIHAAGGLLERATTLLPPDDPRRLELLPELGLVLTEAGELARAEQILTEVITRDGGVSESVKLGAQIERAALRLKSDPRGGWEQDLELVEASLPTLEAAAEPDAQTHRALGRGWFLVGLVRGLWAGQLALGEEALERARIHARAAGDRRQEAEIVGRLGFAAWSGPMPVPQAIDRCVELLASAGEDRFVEASCRRWLGSLVARQGRFDEGRRLVDEAAAGYEELGARLNAAAAAAFGHADIESLAGDSVAAEHALRRGYEELEQLGELGYRASIAGLLARTLHAQGRSEEAERFSRLVEETASEHDLWSQVLYRLTRAMVLAGAGREIEAEEIAREALSIVERTDLLGLQGDVLLDLGEVLRLSGREDEAHGCAERALALYERKGDDVSAERARAVLGIPVTRA